MSVRVALEAAPKKAFASALDWPGWSRGARTPDEALVALVAYAPRYATVAKRAGVAFRPPVTVRGLRVDDRLEGTHGTEFGIPAVAAPSEDGSLSPAELRRLVPLLRAAWETFDAAVAGAGRRHLRLGPRGGGRQVPKMVTHVAEADRAYLAQLGSRGPGPDAAHHELREAFVAALTARATGEAVPNANKVSKLWSPRYAIRRSAWHALDHAWEIEDRLEG